MKRSVASVLVVLALSWTLQADTVYLLGGRQVNGKISKQGDRVIVTAPDGSKQTFEARDVLYIAEGDAPASTSGRTNTGSGAGTATEGGGTDIGPLPKVSGRARVDESLQPDFTEKAPPLSINDVRRPESAAFLLMRSGSLGDGDSEILASQIRKYQVQAKDRRRNTGRHWIQPEDFIRIRKQVEAEFEAAEDDYRGIRRDHSRRYSGSNRSRVPDPDFTPAYQRMKRAGMLWPDAVIRDFLVGVACLKAEQYKQADLHFQRACREAPLVAAFHQGRGMAAMGSDHPVQALEHFMTCLKLQPESTYAVALLRWAVTEVPGTQLQNPQYQKAKTLLETYPQTARPPRPPSNRAERITWLLPGREEKVADWQMPLPFYDRIDTFQALAVPIDDDTLLVDSHAVEQAHEVFVRIAPDVFLPAEPRRRTNYNPDQQPLPDLVSLEVEGVKFQPLKFDKDVLFQPGDDLAVARLSFHAPMQLAPEVHGVRVLRLDESAQPVIELQAQPGDAASPVLAADGRLAGFLAARNQVLADNGGPHRFYGLKHLEPILRRVGRSSYPTYGRAKRTDVEPIQTERKYFVVYGTFGERFTDQKP